MHLHSQVESLSPSGNWMSLSVDHRDPWDRRVSFVQFGGRKFDVFALRQCRTLIWFLHLLWQLGSEGSQFNSCQKKRSFLEKCPNRHVIQWSHLQGRNETSYDVPKLSLRRWCLTWDFRDVKVLCFMLEHFYVYIIYIYTLFHWLYHCINHKLPEMATFKE